MAEFNFNEEPRCPACGEIIKAKSNFHHDIQGSYYECISEADFMRLVKKIK